MDTEGTYAFDYLVEVANAAKRTTIDRKGTSRVEATALVTGPKDLRDQEWLDERVAIARDGIEAVIDIARNWTDGRNVSRLHPGVAAADYILEHVGIVGKEAIEPLLIESNWSHRQIAEVTGVSHTTVNRKASGTNIPLEPNEKVLTSSGRLVSKPKIVGIDGKAFVGDPVAEAEASAELALRRASEKLVFHSIPEATPTDVAFSLMNNGINAEDAIASLESNVSYERELIALLTPLTKKETSK